MISAEDFLREHGVAGAGAAETPEPATPHSPTPTTARSGKHRDGGARHTKGGCDAVRVRRGSGFGYTLTETPQDEEACKEAALRLLDAAARSTGGLRGKLAERGYEPQVIDAVIDRLVELRLLDDEDYARMVVRACVSRMMGMRGAVIELTRKGVDRAIAQSVAQEAAEQGVFDEAAWELGRSVAHKARACSVEVRRRRFWGAGGRKGHDPQVLREVAHALFSADASEE
ncbi:RecX family transcriptional regulator [Bifidobacterium pseudolongum]|uniref:regulatory protein RecX n=1 Tax=Bifidobacterium pseudolongum TaxID=1694 RepID=UPI001CE1C1AA|nr:regulatory protein RecX [Bifidobacterium pseudolongum]UBZ03753.1 RecX family transcriptional regulator [Bifidobacterium pseudolongum]UBZ05325.1 RecX family transcriptional regulator [Bifidobacterium pseudolongum]